MTASATDHPGPILGLDVGGTKIAALLVDDGDRELARRSFPVDGRPLADQVVAAARSTLDAVGAEVRPAAIGIGAPGQIDPEAGTLRLAVNLSEAALPIATIVGEALGVPCWVDHDARAAAAWLYQRAGGSESLGSLAYLSVGTGISAGVIVDGRLLRGVSGLAGEVGHLLAVPEGPTCACGLSGCLEAVAAGPAVARLAADAVAAGRGGALAAGADAAEVYRLAEAGDEAARRIVADVGRHLARAIRGLALAFGVDHVVVGGGLARAGATFLQPILDELERERRASALVREAIGPQHIELLPAGMEAGTWGAVHIARSGLRATSPDPDQRREVADG
jgi:glucokinase